MQLKKFPVFHILELHPETVITSLFFECTAFEMFQRQAICIKFWRAKDCEREQTHIDMKEVDRKRVADCPGCLTKCSEVFALSCGHTFCRECIRGLFVTALKDKSYMPVRCCGKRVDQRLRREVLTLPELEMFEEDLEDIELPRKMYWCGFVSHLT